jgi:hypothetical protein
MMQTIAFVVVVLEMVLLTSLANTELLRFMLQSFDFWWLMSNNAMYAVSSCVNDLHGFSSIVKLQWNTQSPLFYWDRVLAYTIFFLTLFLFLILEAIPRLSLAIKRVFLVSYSLHLLRLIVFEVWEPSETVSFCVLYCLDVRQLYLSAILNMFCFLIKFLVRSLSDPNVMILISSPCVVDLVPTEIEEFVEKSDSKEPSRREERRELSRFQNLENIKSSARISPTFLSLPQRFLPDSPRSSPRDSPRLLRDSPRDSPRSVLSDSPQATPRGTDPSVSTVPMDTYAFRHPTPRFPHDGLGSFSTLQMIFDEYPSDRTCHPDELCHILARPLVTIHVFLQSPVHTGLTILLQLASIAMLWVTHPTRLAVHLITLLDQILLILDRALFCTPYLMQQLFSTFNTYLFFWYSLQHLALYIWLLHDSLAHTVWYFVAFHILLLDSQPHLPNRPKAIYISLYLAYVLLQFWFWSGIQDQFLCLGICTSTRVLALSGMANTAYFLLRFLYVLWCHSNACILIRSSCQLNIR